MMNDTLTPKFIMKSLALLALILSALLSSPSYAALTIGSTEKEIITQIGPPTRRILGPLGVTFLYPPNHTLFLVDAKLEGYSDKNAFNIVMAPKQKKTLTTLDITSSKEDVLTVLGTPDKLDHHAVYERWWYKGEVIEFIEGHIHTISNTVPLKFKFTAPKHIQKTHHSQQTIADLIREKGTPITYRRGFRDDTWYYDYDFYLVQNNLVIHKDTSKPTQAKRDSIKKETDFTTTDIYRTLQMKPQAPKNPYPKPGIDPTIRNANDPQINDYYDSTD